jgi:hypothetical protein
MKREQYLYYTGESTQVILDDAMSTVFGAMVDIKDPHTPHCKINATFDHIDASSSDGRRSMSDW